MAETTLPDLSLIWSSAGDILKPSDSKIQQGWQAEIPPRQWFNWLDNRQDQAIAHIAQHGIAVWSDSLEYQAGKSYVQGSDGLVYKALTTNTNTDPVGNVGDWESAFLSADQAVQVATAAQSRAMTANNVYLSPLQLANAFTGTNQQIATNGFQKLPGGLIIQWGSIALNSTPQINSTFPIPFPNQCLSVAVNADDSTSNYAFGQLVNITNSNFTAVAYTANPGSVPVANTSIAIVLNYIAIGR
jgi:hypothetical protein